jgi:hypothetical protein
MERSTLYVAGGLAGVAALWVILRKRSTESLAGSAGRAVGEGAVSLVKGAVTGVYDATLAAATAPFESPFVLERVPGRVIYSPQRNLLGLQGMVAQPKGEATGTYQIEVQNTSDKYLSGVKLRFVVDKNWPLSPKTVDLGTVDLPPGEGVRGLGEVIYRSLLGLSTVTARLYANNYLVGSANVIAP